MVKLLGRIPGMKPKVLVTRRIFDESLATLARRCDVESNQRDRPFTPK